MEFGKARRPLHWYKLCIPPVTTSRTDSPLNYVQIPPFLLLTPFLIPSMQTCSEVVPPLGIPILLLQIWTWIIFSILGFVDSPLVVLVRPGDISLTRFIQSDNFYINRIISTCISTGICTAKE